MQCQFGPFQFDAANAQLWRGDTPIKIRPKSFDVLAYLMAHAGELVSADELLDAVWGETVVGQEVVKTSIRELRQALGETARDPHYIATVHRRGYRFIAAVTDVMGTTQEAPPTESLPAASEDVLECHDDAIPSVKSSEPESERRQLTILFCDLVGSTSLSEQLDPEDLNDVLKAYYDLCGDAIARFEGHIAQYLGDGLLVYFGYPLAHEDAARRAVHAGLEIIQSLPNLNQRLKVDYGIQVSVRIGIHTGLVMIGQGRAEGGPDTLAVGAPLNLTARIQTAATPDAVWVSEATYRLTQGYFELEEMGSHDLPGVADPLRLYQATAASESQHRLDVQPAERLTPFVGREMESLILHNHWEEVKCGQGQVIILQGEAGIGKSRLARVMVASLSDDAHCLLEGHCSPYHQHTAFYALINLLQRLLQWESHRSTTDKVEQLEQFVQGRVPAAQSVPVLANLLGIQLPEEQYPDLGLSPRKQRQLTLETLLQLVIALSQEQPVIFFIEDGHWLDPTTMEWLNLLVDQGPTTSIFTLLTCRPEFDVPWRTRSHVTTLTLKQLLASQINLMVQAIAGSVTIDAERVNQIVSTTDGVPLFVEEMARLMMTPTSASSGATSALIPATLQDLLMARLDSVGEAKRTAQLGATIGREFSYELLQAVSPLDKGGLDQDLDNLLASNLLYRRDSGDHTSYQFKHSLIQEAAYGSQLRRTRQDQHHRIAQLLKIAVHDRLEGDLELVAHHFTEAGDVAEAVTYWLRAGKRAAQRSAHREAVVHLNRGIELLLLLPETPERTRQELDFHVELGSSLYMIKGFADPEVEQIHLRARSLCQLVGDTEHVFPVLRGLVLFYVNRGRLKTAEALAFELLKLAEQKSEPATLMLGHYSLTIALVSRGKVKEAQEHGKQVIAMHQPQTYGHLVHVYGIDMGVGARSFVSLALWLLGYPDQALAHGQAAVRHAQQAAHPFSLIHTYGIKDSVPVLMI